MPGLNMGEFSSEANSGPLDSYIAVTGKRLRPNIVSAGLKTGGDCGAGVFQLTGSNIFDRYGINGTPLGQAPYGLQGKTVTSTIYGGNEVAMTYFLFLHEAVGDLLILPNPFSGKGLTSFPSMISYRKGDQGLARIDIRANTFSLDRPESIHVSPRCPVKR